MVSSMFEGYDDDYFSSFELEDIPEMMPGSDAHKAFMYDLNNDPSAGEYKEPSEAELGRMIQSLRYANLDLPSDQELIAQARKMLKRELNNSEIEKVKRTKQRMEKLAGKGSFNESKELTNFIREEVSKLQKLDILKEEKIRIKKDLKKLNEGFFKDLWNDATLKTEKDKLRKTDNYNYLYKNLSSTSIRIAGSLNKLLSYSKQDIINIAETMFDDKFEDLALQNPKLLKIVIDDLYEFVHSQKDSENLDEGFFKDLWDDVTSKKEKEELKKIQLRKTDDYKYLYNHLRSVCTKISPDKLAFYTKQDIANMAKIMSDGKFKELALQKPNLLNLVIDDLYNVFHS